MDSKGFVSSSLCSSLLVGFYLFNQIILTQTELKTHNSLAVAGTQIWGKDRKFNLTVVKFLGDFFQAGCGTQSQGSLRYDSSFHFTVNPHSDSTSFLK